MVREFSAGDRVQSKHDNQIMEVVKYITEHQFGVGEVYSDHTVECVWFDDNGERQKGLFDQRTIFKIENHH